jgi:hypothetical protein
MKRTSVAIVTGADGFPKITVEITNEGTYDSENVAEETAKAYKAAKKLLHAKEDSSEHTS